MKKIIFKKLSVEEKKEVLAGGDPDPTSCGPPNDMDGTMCEGPLPTYPEC